MDRLSAAIVFVLAAMAPLPGANRLVYAENGTFGYRDTAVQPWSGYRVHDPDRPLPKRVDPGPPPSSLRPPSDAVILFDGKNLSRWKPTQWEVRDGSLVATKGRLETIDNFGSFQLHLEWCLPSHPTGDLMNRGNNGVFLMGLFEIQIFDPTARIYPDGQTAAVYGQSPPIVNASRAPGEWETYDIFFAAPEFQGDSLLRPARVTLLHNGVLVQNNQEIHGITRHLRLPEPYPPGKNRGPLAFAAHDCPVRFRNIWVRPVD